MKKTYVVLWLSLIILFALLGWIVWLRPSPKTGIRPTVSLGRTPSSHDWYRRSVFYNVDVKMFKDSDGDGEGDFNGLREKLGYIDSLGCNAIWLAPFQPSPLQDDGYDVSDYYGIDKNLGTTQDFKAFIHAAKQRGIRVIMDLVLNHTSIEHPWYQRSRSDTSFYHGWYVWSRERPQNIDLGSAFPGVENGIWTYDSTAHQYYYHRFYHFEPDLNAQNPEVMNEIKKILGFWTRMGLDGFRLDAVPFMIEIPNTISDNFDRQYFVLGELNAYVRSLNPDAMLLGEANVPPQENKLYFGEDEDGMQMLFNFYVNQYLFYALATGKVAPLKDALEKSAMIPPRGQWAYFLRNHDEIDLGRLTKKQRQEVFDRFGALPDMQLYDRGIRRRLAPMMENDPARLLMAYNVLVSLPGTPFLRYGEELGMGDDLHLPERLSVRTPMQWSDAGLGGFTSGLMAFRDPIDTGRFSFHRVNAAAENTDSTSLLNRIRFLLRRRQSCDEILKGSCTFDDAYNSDVLAIRYQLGRSTVMVIHNFGYTPQTARVQWGKAKDAMQDMDGADIYTGDNISLQLQPSQSVWLRSVK